MYLAVDVQYTDQTALVAGVIFDGWEDCRPREEIKLIVPDIQDYEPGNFYKRELPCILSLIKEYSLQPSVIVIDGYVFLDGVSKTGLGKHLHDVLDGRIPVISVAKSRFKDIPPECEVFRGESNRPLFVTAAGMSLNDAKENIKFMHGQYRIPDLLKIADQLCRQIRK